MKHKFIILSIIISINWAIGLQGLIIPQNGYILSVSSTGIAGNNDPILNPAINISKSSINFSSNYWLGDIKGSHFSLKKNNKFSQKISFQTWNAESIELRNDKPSTYPLGTFSIHFLSASYSMSHDFNSPYRLGFCLQTNYSHLFTEDMFGITLDLGANYNINPIIKIGAVIRNIGYEFSNNLTTNLPTQYGIGSNFYIPFIKTSVLSDIIYDVNLKQEFRFALNTNWKWFNLNAGSSYAINKNVKSIGFSFKYRKWKINYGIYFHENNKILGEPQFFDFQYYL